MDRAKTVVRPRIGTLPGRFRVLVHSLLSDASRGLSQPEFARHACRALLDFSGCDLAEAHLEDGGSVLRYRAPEPETPTLASGPGPAQASGRDPAPAAPQEAVPPEIIRSILRGGFAVASPFFTRGGSFWTGDASRPVLLREAGGADGESRTLLLGGRYASIALVPIPVELRTAGVLLLASLQRDFIARDDVPFYEAAAEALGIALAHRSAQWALKERVKELTCLYGIARLLQRPHMAIDGLMGEIAELLPPGWQYPWICHARISLDGRQFESAGFREGPQRMTARLVIDGEDRGSVEVHYTEAMPEAFEGPFLREERNLLDAVVETVGVALGRRRAQWALGERVKELTCLYGIANIARRPEISLADALHAIAALLPPGWQYPEITCAQIVLDDRPYTTPGFGPGTHSLGAEISIRGTPRGRVEVVYREERLPADEGPFLKEERNLINQVARQVEAIIEYREAEEEKALLQEQLRHADRLATIGQLSAGAAHELNEPLGNILGFAQLAKDCPQLPTQARQDLEKIESAALHAREVIKKLMLFARQVPPKKSWINLNGLVRDGLYFMESRCLREGIQLVFQLSEQMPDIVADPGQIHQVLVNLVVNAVQAMPEGGTLTISTHSDGRNVYLRVRDTGVGMDPDVVRQIFIPFFTTKDVGQGTGLGLSVVHGIVADHGGTVQVQSSVGEGSSFEVRLPVQAGLRGGEGR